MRSSQDEKKKERRKSVPGVVGVDDPYSHSNVSYRQLTALVGKRRSHSYGLWCKSTKNNSHRNNWNTLFFEQPPRLL